MISMALMAGPRSQPGKQPTAPRLRVLTYNIHHAEGVDGKFDLGRIARLIKKEKPDLVAVQEVDVKTRRSDGVDQAAELARLTGMHYFFGKFMDYNGGEYGQMVLSKHPIVRGGEKLPRPVAEMPAAATRITLKVPMRFTWMTPAKCSSGIGPSRPTMRRAGAMPAQFTAALRPPM